MGKNKENTDVQICKYADVQIGEPLFIRRADYFAKDL